MLLQYHLIIYSLLWILIVCRISVHFASHHNCCWFSLQHIVRIHHHISFLFRSCFSFSLLIHSSRQECFSRFPLFPFFLLLYLCHYDITTFLKIYGTAFFPSHFSSAFTNSYLINCPLIFISFSFRSDYSEVISSTSYFLTVSLNVSLNHLILFNNFSL